MRLWDAVTSDCVVELRGHDNFVFCVDQHHSTVVTGSFDETVKIWDLRTGEVEATFWLATLLLAVLCWILGSSLVEHFLNAASNTRIDSV